MRLDGTRRISYLSLGPETGFPVLALHGTPGSRFKFRVAAAHAHRLGLRVISLDRWGYGGTDRHPAPSLPAFAADIATFADALGIGRFAVIGVSGGGPYATAVAACLPERVAALALVAPVGPMYGEDHTAISRFHRFCFGPFARSRFAPRLVFGGLRRVLQFSPDFGMRIAMAAVPAADRRVLATSGVSERLAAAFAEGLKSGADGPAIDLSLFGRPWELQLGTVSAPSRLWIGTADRNVPMVAARRLAERLHDCSFVELAGEGHLWVALNYGVVLDWVAEAAVQTTTDPKNTKGAADAAPSTVLQKSSSA